MALDQTTKETIMRLAWEAECGKQHALFLVTEFDIPPDDTYTDGWWEDDCEKWAREEVRIRLKEIGRPGTQAVCDGCRTYLTDWAEISSGLCRRCDQEADSLDRLAAER